MVDKKSSFEEKKEYLKKTIENLETPEAESVYNLILMLGNVNLDEKLFEEPSVIFNSLMEFSDLKIELKQELKVLKQKLAYYYFLTIKSCRPIVSIRKENILKLSPLYRILLMNLGVFSLGSLLAVNIKSFTEEQLKEDTVIDDAIMIMQRIMSPIAILGSIIEEIKA